MKPGSGDDASASRAPRSAKGRKSPVGVTGSSPLGGTAAFDDPMARVFGLDSGSGPGKWATYGLAALALMTGLGVGARALADILNPEDRDHRANAAPQEIEIQSEPPPEPPAPPAPEPTAQPEPAPRAVPHDAPPPAPAQAAKVLAQEPDPNTPVDLTGDTIVMGNGDTYVGGVTASNGTSRTAVRGLTSPTGSPVPQPAVTGPDRSRRPSLADGAEWSSCPFPPESDVAQIDDTYVLIRVDVRADGTPRDVTVLKDPGNGFGREARRCAMDKHWAAALDHDGHPIDGTAQINIHFSR